MTEKEKVATPDDVTAANDPKQVMVVSTDPATAQQVGAVVQLTDLAEAASFLNLDDGYTVLSLLTQFEKRIHTAIKTKKTKNLKPLTDAKNILLRYEIEQQVKKNGQFDLTDHIPFETTCPDCRGSGELYKFFRNAAIEECKFCDDGYNLITCRACKGTTRYKNKQNDLKINVSCNRCEKDSDGKPTGKEKVKCRKCKGTNEFRKLVIAPKIESTTHCRNCKGRGFTLPEPQKASGKHPSNPAMAEALKKAEEEASSSNLGDAVKSADVKE